MKVIINLIAILSLLLVTKNALAVPICTGPLTGGSNASPLTAGRQFGPNQWEFIQYTDPQNQPAISFGFPKGTFSGFLYNGTAGGVKGFSDRHVLEGVLLNPLATPSTCNTPITQGQTGPCPNTDYVPDACPDADVALGQALEYPYRSFASPSTYATIIWGASANNLADVGTMNINNLTTDFLGQHNTPPFQAGAFDNQVPNVAVNPYTGPLNAKDKVIVETPTGPQSGFIGYVANYATASADSGDPRNPAYHHYTTTLTGGKFLYIISTATFAEGMSGTPVYTANTVDAQGHPCHQLLGTLQSGDVTVNPHAGVFQSFAYNIQPALQAADGKTYTPAGSCTAVGPKTANGNIDNDGFTFNTPCNSDLAMTAQTNIFNMLNSKCTAPSGHTCGTTTWESVIASTLLNTSDAYASIGYTNESDITKPHLHVSYYCPNLSECDPTALKNALMAKTNSTGTTLATALTNWGVFNTTTVSQMITMVSTLPTMNDGIVNDYQN